MSCAELDFTINTYYPGRTTMSSALSCLRNRSRCSPARPSGGAGHLAGELMDLHWTMPTPRGTSSSCRNASNSWDEPRWGSSANVLILHQHGGGDFLSILPVELGNDPLMADKLVMIPIREVLPTATYYLIQRRDTRQTPLTASLITLFRRQSRQLFP